MTMTQERPAEAVDSFAALSAAVHPAWHQAILRLASATERVAAKLDLMFDTAGGSPAFRENIRELTTSLIDFLDEVEDDADLEPWLGSSATNGDDREAEDEHDEPSLGWTDSEAKHGRYSLTDKEVDRSDDEPCLASTEGIAMNEGRSQEYWAQGRTDDLEDEHDGAEPDDEGDGNPDDEPEPDDEDSGPIDLAKARRRYRPAGVGNARYLGPVASLDDLPPGAA
jgi:hypothetical protein